ncbi:MAG TPA: ABC transporter substrate-binding protein [Stellaceae bacterium]|nr:ABC transporter substrate-binding protein [Stellaceae bacterium]
MMSRRLLPPLLILGLAWTPATARATAATDPAAFIDTLVHQGIDIIKNAKQMPDQERDQKFRALLESGFDMPRIARFVLGRYWNTASEQDRQQFTKTFEDWVIKTYSSRFQRYAGETVKVDGTRPVNEQIAIVLSQIDHASGPPTKVEWRVRHEGNDYKIVDAEVEGVSMALTERDEFASAIQQQGGTVAALNKALEQKLASDQGGEPTLQSR